MVNKWYFFIAFLTLSCSEQDTKDKLLPGYDLGKPEKFAMPEALDEISGIGFHNGNPDTLYAEQDEEGRFYYLRLGDDKATHSKFGKRGDYEDMAILHEQVILLRSDGTLFSFPFGEARQDEITDTKEWDNLLPRGEYEGLCGDATNNKIYVLCKHCDGDKTSEAITAYILQLQPDGSITHDGSVSISVKAIAKKIKEKKLNFHPSALAKSPLNQEWYILSSVNKLLVVADNNWQIKDVVPLNPALFRQPEGIAFDMHNNLYISNEGDNMSKGNVLKFVFKK